MLKNQEELLAKLNISQLNPMQQAMEIAAEKHDNITLLSPTGSGKTLGFLLPLLSRIQPQIKETQALILVPSRELALQIEQVLRQMGTGYKINAPYGGRAMSKDKEDLLQAPIIIVGTPGRIADHFRNDRIDPTDLDQLVLDEFDKSLETGFESDMSYIISRLPNLVFRTLTSATSAVEIPAFVGLQNAKNLNFLDTKKTSKLEMKLVEAPETGKLQVLGDLLKQLGDQNGIIFCNYRDSIQQVSDFLDKHKIPHSSFYGTMEQKDRERALIKFRNASTHILLATDLAARGIDIPELKYIIHFELPIKSEEFTHRNGRTARVDKEGTAYIFKARAKPLPDFIPALKPVEIKKTRALKPPKWTTLFISGGRKDKISKGDLAGIFFKQGNLKKEELGVIELKSDCAFVAVPKELARELQQQLNNTRIKKRKVRVYEI